MNTNATWSYIKVGTLITAAFIIAFSAVFFSGNIRRLFTPRSPIIVKMENAGGLRSGAPVWLLGIEVGTVTGIEINHDGVLVTLSVGRKYLKYLGADACASILTMGLLGDKYVEINPGLPMTSTLRAGGVIPGTVQPGFQEAMDASARSIRQVEAFIVHLDDLLAKVTNGRGNISQLFRDTSLYRNLVSSTRSLSSIITTFEQSNGTLQRLIKDPSLYNSFQASLASIERMASLVTDTSGSLYMLTQENTLYRDLTGAAERLHSLIDTIQYGTGVAGTLVSDRELALEVKKTVEAVSSLIADIKKNPGRYFKVEIF